MTLAKSNTRFGWGRGARGSRVKAGFAALVALCIASACGEPEPRPNVVLITLDTVRAESLSCYGHERETTPRLDAFAKSATLFENSHSNGNWTPGSHASIFTGRFIFEHGCHYNDPTRAIADEAPDDYMVIELSGLSEENTTMAEVLQEAGYATAGFVANGAFLNPRQVPGISQGFRHYKVLGPLDPAQDVNRRVFEWLERFPGENPENRPFFLFVNYMDAHTPFNIEIHDEWSRERAPRPDPGESAEDTLMRRLVERAMAGETEYGGMDRDVHTQYEVAIRNLDREIGNLIDYLKKSGLYDNTAIVITSDHGEFFGEHGLASHPMDLYRPGTFVPLIVKDVGQTEGRTVETPTMGVDVARLIAASLDEATRLEFERVFPNTPGSHPLMSELYYSHLRHINAEYKWRFRRVRTSWEEEGYKLIHSSDGNHELYYLPQDSEESNDLAAEEPEKVQELILKMEEFRRGKRRLKGSSTIAPDETQMETLKVLGYL